MALLPPLLLGLVIGAPASTAAIAATATGQRTDDDPAAVAGIPRWNTTVPDHTQPWAGLPQLPASSTAVWPVYRANPTVGTYNHGPMIVEYGGLLIVNWYAGQRDEDAPGERVLFAASADGGRSFTSPLPMFDRLSPTGHVGTAGILVSNHEFAMVSGRLYGMGTAHQCTACPQGSVPGRAAGLLRRIYVDSSSLGTEPTVRLGPAVWRSSSRASVPEGPGTMKIMLVTEVADPQLRADAEILMRQTVIEVPVRAPAGVTLNERSVYQRTFLSQVQLVMLLRCESIQFEWASICNLYLGSNDTSTPVVAARARQIACNWSEAVPTTIPDSHTRTHVGALPSGDTYLLGTQVSNTSVRHKRDPLTLSLSPDGVSFTRAWALRYGAPERRYNGSHKDYGFAYPSAVVDRQRQTLTVAYSVNKEDIEIMTIGLGALLALKTDDSSGGDDASEGSGVVEMWRHHHGQEQPPRTSTRTLSPPRGWNSYDSFTWRVTEAEFLDNCQYVATHLRAHGYRYCVVDYLWFMNLNATAMDGSPWTPGEQVQPSSLSIDEHGRPLPALDRWPSAAGGVGFAAVAAKVRAMGLELGIHVMRGVLSVAVAARSPVLGGGGATADEIAMSGLSPHKDGSGSCPWYPAAISVDVSTPAGTAFYDAQYALFSSWGVSFVKNDCVFGNYVPLEIKAQSASIAKLPRPMVYSLSPGTSDAAKAKEIAPYVNMYRLTGDVWDNFNVGSALQDIEFVTATGLAGKPGLNGLSYPDMDMLPFGYICSQNAATCPDHLSRMPRRTQQALMAVWAMAGSPIFFDGDCRKMDPQTLALLTMTEVLEINSAASNRTQLYALLDGGIRTGGAFAAARSVGGSTVRYVLLLHPPGDDYPPPLPRMTIEWRGFGLPAASVCSVRDVFSNASLGHQLQANVTITVNDSFVLLAVEECTA